MNILSAEDKDKARVAQFTAGQSINDLIARVEIMESEMLACAKVIDPTCDDGTDLKTMISNLVAQHSAAFVQNAQTTQDQIDGTST